MKETENLKIEQEFLKGVDHGIITDGLCDSEEAQNEFDAIQKGKAPLSAQVTNKLDTSKAKAK